MYGEFNGDVFNFRSLPEVLPVSQKHWKTVTSTNICLLAQYNGPPRCFPNNSCSTNFLVILWIMSWPEVLSGFQKHFLRSYPRQETTYEHSDNLKFSDFDKKQHYIERLFIVFDKPEVLPAMTGCLKYIHSIQHTRIDRKACGIYVF